MRIIPSELLAEKLRGLGRKDLLRGFEIPDETYSRYLAEAERLHPDYSKARKDEWAAYSAVVAYHRLTKAVLRKIAWTTSAASIANWIWRLAIIGLLALIAINTAHAQSQIDTIQFQDSAGTPIKTYASPFRFRCGTGVSCTSLSGNVLRLDSSVDLSGYIPSLRMINTTAPLRGGGNLGSDLIFSLSQAGAGSDGYLSSADWNTFNGKLSYTLPTSYPGLVIWLRSDLGVTVNGSNQVSKWADQSGNGNDFTQSTDSKKPVLTPNIMNGLPGLVFTSANQQWLTTSSIHNIGMGWARPFALFVVAQTYSSGVTQGIFALNSANAGGGELFGLYTQGGTTYVQGYVTPYQYFVSYQQANMAPNNGVIATFYTTGGNVAYITARESGVTLADKVTWNFGGITRTMANGMVGGESWGTLAHPELFFNGAILEIIYYNVALNPIQVASIEQYLWNRYRIVGTYGYPVTPTPPLGSSHNVNPGTYTVADTDHMLNVNCDSGNATLNLPTLDTYSVQRTYEITRESAAGNTVMIVPAGTNKIQPGNLSSYSLVNAYDNVVLRGAVTRNAVYYWEILSHTP